jgi:hypothetical protein
MYLNDGSRYKINADNSNTTTRPVTSNIATADGDSVDTLCTTPSFAQIAKADMVADIPISILASKWTVNFSTIDLSI